jgi:steroid 5-alpha reductase family enzyme
MENVFQGLVLFLIGLSDLLAVHTIREAEISGGLGLLGLILVIVGIIWAIIGDKIELKIKWTG